MVEPVADEVYATGIYREHLVVLFNSEFQITLEVSRYIFQQGMQIVFVMVQDYQVISVTEIKTDPFDLF